MKTIRFNFHSVVDLITNSSTEMFADFRNSVEPCKELINEMFKACGIDKTCDEVFDIHLENEDDECEPPTLVIAAKEVKYEILAIKIEKLLDSVETNEYMN